MKNHVFVAVACLFLAACSDGGETKVAKLEAIPLGVAFENQTELKTSDCFKKIRYVALETTDSCLVGQGAYATILNDWIVVTSGRDRCQLFDKKTGRFIRSVGHVGEDPEGYSDVYGGWQNPYTGQLSFHGWKNEIVVYGADGRFDHIWMRILSLVIIRLPTVCRPVSLCSVEMRLSVWNRYRSGRKETRRSLRTILFPSRS